MQNMHPSPLNNISNFLQNMHNNSYISDALYQMKNGSITNDVDIIIGYGCVLHKHNKISNSILRSIAKG